MGEKLEFSETIKYFGSIAHVQEMQLGKYKVLYLLKVNVKSRTEFFMFDAKEITELSDDEMGDLVQSSPLFKTRFNIENYTEGKYKVVSFNIKIPLYTRLDLFTKTFLDRTKNVKVQRNFQIGKGWNPNPKLYKYVWWVFHNGVKSDNIEELINSNESRFLNLDNLEKVINELIKTGEPYAYVQKCYPRLGVKVFDFDRMKKENPDIEFAPALEDDKEKEEILPMYDDLVKYK